MTIRIYQLKVSIVTDTLDPKNADPGRRRAIHPAHGARRQVLRKPQPDRHAGESPRASALADTGAKVADLAAAIDTVAVVRFTADSPGEQGRLTKRMFRNPPASLAEACRREPASRALHRDGRQHAAMARQPHGRRDRQAANARWRCWPARNISRPSSARCQTGVDLGWSDLPEADPGSDPEEIGDMRAGIERARARLWAAVSRSIPIRCSRTPSAARRSATVEDHLKWLGQFFSPFSKVASENPYAWFPTYRSPEEISTPTEKNRFVGFPYTKYLNAVIEVDMSAAVVMTSVGKARELGIPSSKWVFLHGCARRQRHLARQRARELPFLARDPRGRPPRFC